MAMAFITLMTEMLEELLCGNVILEGQDPDVGFMSGVFQSFNDAPGGFSEELDEFTWALGAEYVIPRLICF